MERNEAPEKIYITPNIYRKWQLEAIDNESVEYTRTDVLYRENEDKDILSSIDTFKMRDHYEQCVQHDSIKSGIQAHAETYSFNIESKLFNQLTKEQQKLWRKEIEQAVISGGEVGVELARDARYKENLEAKEVDLNNFIKEEFNKYSCVDGYGQLSISYNMAEFYGMIKRLTKAQKGE